jgi:hypothetical protein
MEKNNSRFRKWLREIYAENCEEHRVYQQPLFTLADYWNRYKWWLRREYRYRVKNGKI